MTDSPGVADTSLINFGQTGEYPGTGELDSLPAWKKSAGFAPLETLPAAWFNGYMNELDTHINQIQNLTVQLQTEMANLMSAASVTPSSTNLTQILQSIQKLISAADTLLIAPEFDAQASYSAGQYVLYNGYLYICTINHTGAWDSTHFSVTKVGTQLKDLKDAIDAGGAVIDLIGNLDNLTTDTKTNVVAAINEVDSHTDTNTSSIGTLTNLTTDAKTSLVAAINEVDSHTDTNTSAIGTLTNLTTDTKTNVVAAINEVDSHTDTNTSSIGTLTNLTTDAKTSLVAAINEVDSHTDTNTSAIGTLTNLTTDAKTNLVSAINEVNAKAVEDIAPEAASANEEKNLAFFGASVSAGTPSPLQFDADKQLTFNPSTNAMTVAGDVQAKNTVRRSEYYNTSAANIGKYVLLAQARDSRSGNHDLSFAGYITGGYGTNLAANNTYIRFSLALRISGSQVEGSFFGLSYKPTASYIATREFDASSNTCILRLYGRIPLNYTRLRLTIDTLTVGDVFPNASVYNTALTLPMTVTDTLEGTQITPTYIQTEGITYSTSEFDMHKKWIDGKSIYGRVLTFSSSTFTQNTSFPTSYSILTFTVFNNTLYVGTYEHGIYTSTNGSTFTQNTSFPTSYSVNALVAYNDTLYVGTTSNGIYTSTNGSTFTQNTSFPTSYSVPALAVFNNTLYVGTTSNGIYTSTNGSTFTQNTSFPTSYNGRAFTVFSNTLYVGAVSHGIYTSTNGSTFTQNTSFPTSYEVNALVAYNDTLYVGTTSNGIYTSTNGSTFTQNTSFPTTYSVRAFIVFNNTLYVGTNSQGIYTSTHGSTFTQNTSFPTTYTVRSLEVYDSALYAGTASHGIYILEPPTSTESLSAVETLIKVTARYADGVASFTRAYISAASKLRIVTDEAITQAIVEYTKTS